MILFERVEIVGNKANGRNSKQVFQENKALQIFQKMNTSYPLIRTHTYQGFFRKFGVLCFLETPVLRFAFLPYYRRNEPWRPSTNLIPNLLNPLSINPTNWLNTLKQFVSYDHFVWLTKRTASDSYFWVWHRSLFIYLSKQEPTFSRL